ncbi:MAG: cytochrome c oxidase assembly protein [Pseudonocardiales bacterium]|nr:cytochrome c oxidase assembly protein [Pseudonocardiales bacterium]
MTLAQQTLPPALRSRLGRVRCSRVARALTLPPVVGLLLVGPPLVIYLSGLHGLMLRYQFVSAVADLALLGAGCLCGQPAANRPDALAHFPGRFRGLVPDRNHRRRRPRHSVGLWPTAGRRPLSGTQPALGS